LLAEALFDEDTNVRWASVEVLTHLGKDVIPAMLNALSCHPDLNPGRQAVFQALKGATFNCPEEQARLKPLMECLHMPDTCNEAPAVAGRMLRE
jgi:HEAT repeat protein